MHVDLSVAGGPAAPLEEREAKAHAEAARLQSLGARQLWVNDEWHGFSIVMADPEGNEFCLHQEARLRASELRRRRRCRAWR
jgi:Glyoxalase-like domain